MIGLLVKDLIELKKYLIYMLVFVVLICGAALFFSRGHVTDFLAGSLTGILCVVFPIFSITSFSLDDMCKWDRYGLTMPVSRKQIVLSKYLLVCLLEVLSLSFSAAVMGMIAISGTSGMGTREIFLSVGLCACVAIMLIAIMFPLTFRFGAEKTRLILLSFCLVPLLINLLKDQLSGFTISEGTLITLFKLFPVIALALFVGSIFLSIAIYEKKEL